jgi:hypothetical protein
MTGEELGGVGGAGAEPVVREMIDASPAASAGVLTGPRNPVSATASTRTSR